MFAPGQNQLLANLSLLLFFKDLSIVRFYDFKKNFRGMCFTVQLSKIGFALPFVSNSFAIISCRFLPVKNFFQLFWSCFCFSLAATLISYHIQPAVVKNFFHFFLTALWSLRDLSDATLIEYHCIHGLSTVIFMFFYFFANNQNIRFFMSFIQYYMFLDFTKALF